MFLSSKTISAFSFMQNLSQLGYQPSLSLPKYLSLEGKRELGKLFHIPTSPQGTRNFCIFVFLHVLYNKIILEKFYCGVMMLALSELHQMLWLLMIFSTISPYQNTPVSKQVMCPFLV